jgi:hypothetical protein
VAGFGAAVHGSTSSASSNAELPDGTSGRQYQKTTQPGKIAEQACTCNLANELIKSTPRRRTQGRRRQENGREMKQTMIAVASFVALGILTVHAERVVSEMTPQVIEEAIKAGAHGSVSDGKLTRSSGFSWGSAHIATFSTPYMRVASAAQYAKKTYQKFTAADVTPDMIQPELHVYAWSQGARTGGPSATSVQAIVITPRKGSNDQKADHAIQSTRFEDLPAVLQNIFGAQAAGSGRMAVFPLSALSEDNEIHVVYDKSARIGMNAVGGSGCADCSIAFNLKNVR